MVLSTTLLATLLTGLALAGVLAWMYRARDWQSSPPVAASGARGTGGSVVAPRASPGIGVIEGRNARYVVAILLVAGVVAGVGFVLAGPIDASAVVVGVAVLVGAYAVVGVYLTARSRGHASARSTAEAAITGGTLLLLAVVFKLLLAGKF